ncbi:carbohydrate ABC transporter permease [Youxingia wuxianensis]|uniref:Sugar ABC transporter permease n=1 Tax=Youxingia wuxianensis TaxID=2763678 RepID=A0A926ESE2_9FIRM|nr:sugar ABC transporter permease [Youxingia wuxianensis]MBC8585415.1 sugar ABC transporter permease [Youxingia wuxianensis]
MLTTKKDRKYLWLLVAPALIIILVAQAYPLMYSLVVSFREWALATSDVPLGFTLDNYAKALTNPNFLYSCKISLQFMVRTIIIELVCGFSLAYLFIGSSKIIKLCRTVVLIPMSIASVVCGNMWRIFFDTNTGMVNLMLSAVGIQGPNWLGDPNWAMTAAIISSIWQYVSFSFLIYTASMTSIPDDLIEAAKIDGATRLGIIRKIFIPMTMPATLLILIFRIIDSFFVFDQIYTLTFGGPGTSTQVVSMYIYNQGLKYYNISYASACAWVVMILAFFICGLLLQFKKRVENSF